ncbi:MAG: sigma-54 dependent transcriptional regulator [Proteobacteria bacterium]|nr:sigma-54 dependent transcriptional regulator [Pseudomonadota bacterium]MBU1389076.1 sigma-54 dependent transcriptional regulator [Pseudomonadota bacterium]MBU1543629.1 sigma-54 dependent transcriptional regulator [Pseudomonadota bacterium]MBU2431590.1 sigma-54 dependent transcriptional regulator [Pseudomonadota bacterium]MBU2479833.1 sigma-54 dependent transcriptional regulator [Pseudomonadota bacterium]
MNKILVVDDDPSILTVLEMRLEAGGYDVLMAASVKEALSVARENAFDLALLDYKLGDGNGIELMEKLKEMMPLLQVIILTAYGTIQNAVTAMEKGAYTYLAKPFDDEQLMFQIKSCMEKSRLSREVENLRDMVASQLGFENIICKSQSMIEVLKLVKQTAGTDSTILISGESGTGKELIAKSVHHASLRKDEPFVAVNCAALPENLFESELFGYEKGAFTGADKRRPGFFAKAQKGTFFFDEVSEIPMTKQVKLLRVLQESEYYPLGSSQTVKLDTRIIAATNKDLVSEIAAGRFRQDLYYRIHVIPIHVPPLRQRLECIPHLADHFLRKYASDMRKPVKRICDAGLNKILKYAWPGNVRELKNVIEYAVAMCDSEVIGEELILQSPGELMGNDILKPLKVAKKDFEKEYIRKLLRLTEGNVSQSAKFAGKYRADFYALMKKYDLEIEDYRSS